MKEFSDYRPEKPERILKPEESRSSPKEGPQLSRRAFLRGTLTSAALYAAGGEALLRTKDINDFFKDNEQRARFKKLDKLSAREREEWIRERVRVVHAFVRSPEGERIMNRGSKEELFSELLAKLPPLLREHVRGTSYDVPKAAWPSVPLAGKLGRIAVQHSRDKSTPEVPFIGNATYLGNNEYLTNWHVLVAAMRNGTVPPSQYEQLSRLVKISGQGLDVVRIKMGPESSQLSQEAKKKRFSPPILPPTIPDAILNGSLITVAGIDPDESAGPDGTKVFPSVALKVTQNMANLLAPGDPRLKELVNSYLYLLPPGEARSRQYPSRSGSRILDFLQANEPPASGYLYAGGTSGSPVLKDGQLVGVNHSSLHAKYNGSTYDLGFFHPMGKVREALRSGMNYDTSVKPTALSRNN